MKSQMIIKNNQIIMIILKMKMINNLHLKKIKKKTITNNQQKLNKKLALMAHKSLMFFFLKCVT